MREGFGLIIFLGIPFIAWLMYSTKWDKEMFLAYTWGAMIVIEIIGFFYEAVFGRIS